MSQDVDFTEIPPDECLELLSRHSMGRLGLVHQGRPFIFPVNYVLDGKTIVFRTDPGLKLSDAPLRKVALDVDDVDLDARTGCGVLVQGHAFRAIAPSFGSPSPTPRVAIRSRRKGPLDPD